VTCCFTLLRLLPRASFPVPATCELHLLVLALPLIRRWTDVDPQINWPSSLQTVFKFASFTTVNVDSASPECSVKGLGYVQKWYFTMLLPGLFALMLFFVYVGKVVVAYVKWRLTPPSRRKPLKGKGYATLVNLYLGALNLMYIFLVQKALEVRRVRVCPSLGSSLRCPFESCVASVSRRAG
jgi:hypothetical protein